MILYGSINLGFMLENSSWGEGDSRTIQFLIPKVLGFIMSAIFIRLLLINWNV